MAQCGKAEGQVEIECSADKFFEVWTQKTESISKMCPDKVAKVELTNPAPNNSCKVGTVQTWYYISPLDGKIESGMTKVEEIEEEKRYVRHRVIDGALVTKYYKTWKDKMEVIPKGDNCSIVKWSVLEWEKRTQDAPHPKVFLDILLAVAKDIGCLL